MLLVAGGWRPSDSGRISRELKHSHERQQVVTKPHTAPSLIQTADAIDDLDHEEWSELWI